MATSMDQDRSPTRLPCLLFELSDELLILITKWVHKRTDIRNFSNTCHKLHAIADPLLYQSVTLKSISSCNAFAQTLTNNHVRAEEVQNLRLDIPCHIGGPEDSEDIDQYFIYLLVKLRYIDIRFPLLWIEDGDWDFYPVPQVTSLQTLQTCTLDLTTLADEMWYIDIAEAVFRHPTLKSLTIYHAYSTGKILEGIESGSTDLQELSFHRCDIQPATLTEILRIPRCLKQFTVGIPLENNLRGQCPVTDYIDTMRPVYETLECFRLIPGTSRKWGTGPARGIEKFSALKYLELPLKSLLRLPPGVNGDYILRFPPKLEVLKISPDAEKRTHTVCVVWERNLEGGPPVRKLVLSIEGDQEFPKLQNSCKESGISLQVVRESISESFHGLPVWKIPEQIS